MSLALKVMGLNRNNENEKNTHHLTAKQTFKQPYKRRQS